MAKDPEYILTCLQDVLSALEETEKVFENFPNRYDNVKPDFLWLLVKRHFPLLKSDVTRLITELDPDCSQD